MPSRTLKTTVLPPTPAASVMRVMAVKSGARARRRKTCFKWSMNVGMDGASGGCAGGQVSAKAEPLSSSTKTKRESSSKFADWEIKWNEELALGATVDTSGRQVVCRRESKV